MKKLKTILQSKYLYILLLIFISLYVLFFTKIIKWESRYSDGQVTLEGKVINYSKTKEKLIIVLKTPEKIRATYYLENNDYPSIEIGNTILITGKLSTPSNNTIPNTFNYKDYLYSNRIYKTLTVDTIKVTKDNSLLSKIKDFIYQKTDHNEYLQMFITGDKSQMDDEVYDSFKNTGVAHLLAISGMHVSVFLGILNKFLKKVKTNIKNIILSVFLIFYAYIVNFSASILRVVFFFIINNLSKTMELKLNGYQVLFWTAFTMLLFNPFFLYQVGFIYSFVTVFSIIFTQKYIKGSYIKDTLIISFWALLFTLPITVSLNYEINLITFVSNIILIPFITFILYPLALICVFLPFLLDVFNILTTVMEWIIIHLNEVSFLTINIPKLNFIVIVIYYVLLLLLVYYNSKNYFWGILILISIVKILVIFDSNYYVDFFDVGQGDSSIIITPYKKEVILIDTGGIMSYDNKKLYYVSENIILYLKSIGITTIDYLIITHGDYDHMGDAISLVENFKVRKVIFNCGEFNDLEQELIKVLDKKNIPYYSCIKELNINDNILHFLNNKLYDNENDNSSVVYTKFNNYKFLFMGDAGVEVEEDLIEKYNLKDIDVLKVGHHGSKTSSSKNFINEIKPKYSIISVGKNNRYGHPNKSVLENLSDSKIYRIDQDGSIMFKFKNNKLQIETYRP